MINRNSTDNSPRKSSPHHRISVKDVIRDFQAGLLTPAGAIFYLVAASRKIGEAVRVSRSWICKSLDIPQSTYYRAIATLEEQCRLQVSAPDEMVLRVPISTNEGSPDYIFLEECSQKWESDSQKWESDSQKWESDSQKWESDSQKWESQPPEPTAQAESTFPQLELSDQSFKQLTTEVSPTPHPVDQRLKNSGIELTEAQLLQLEHFEPEKIDQAIEVVRNAKRVEDKVKFFFKALRSGWRPNLPRESTQNFVEWFERSRAQGKVIASLMGEDGILRVLMTDERWLPLADAILEVSGS
jgi:hypothetical protein